MKKNALLLALGFVALAGAGDVFAQASCAAPGLMNQDGSNVTGDTCAAGVSNFVPLYCGGIDSPENDVIYRFTIANPHTATTITLTPTTAGWDPAMGLLTGGCNPNNACSLDSNNAPGAAETITPVPGTAGNYFLVITTSPGGNPGCGAFTLGANGTLPVSLQNFSVE